MNNPFTDHSARLIFLCPGCESHHFVRVRGPGPVWQFNGDVVKPTVSPSILVTYHHHPTDHFATTAICHSFIRDGQIEFLSDCTHKLSGKTIDLPPHDWT